MRNKHLADAVLCGLIIMWVLCALSVLLFVREPGDDKPLMIDQSDTARPLRGSLDADSNAPASAPMGLDGTL